jgi:CRISPR-associated protein Cmr3
MMIVKFKPIEPMMFRGPGEFSPVARGPQAHATSLPLPTPSTVSGCLATAMDRKPTASTASWDDAVEEALGLKDKGFLRGPYLIVNDEIYLWYQEKLVNSENLKTLRRIELREALREGKPLDDLLNPLRIETVLRVGIGLKEGKTVDSERGLMYLAKFVDYEATFKTTAVWIAVEVHNFDVKGVSGKIVRLGGEGKLARLDVVGVDENKAKLYSFVEDFIRRPSDVAYLYLVTHAFIQEVSSGLEKIDDGVYLWPGITRHVNDLMNKVTNGGVDVEYIIGRTVLLGAGYDLSRNVKKPMYIALEPGSILKVHLKANPRELIYRLYEKSLSFVGGKLGYGTFLPIQGQ